MSHYFINDSNVKSDRRYLGCEKGGYNFRFVSDNGVFSKNEIDEGSNLLIDVYLRNGKNGRVLDVGAGIGVIGIMVSKINDCEVDMLEINSRAVGLCAENILLNKCGKCNVYESDVYDKANGKYDAVISNPPIRAGKDVVFTILQRAKEFLKLNGELWVVIRKNQGEESAKRKMQDVYGNCEIVKRDKGFYVLRSVNFSGGDE